MVLKMSKCKKKNNEKMHTNYMIRAKHQLENGFTKALAEYHFNVGIRSRLVTRLPMINWKKLLINYNINSNSNLFCL